MKKGGMLIFLILAIVGVVAFMLYKQATSEELPDDEWFEFEEPDEI